jgi:predicted NBD/HSP70 family sugar kinase
MTSDILIIGIDGGASKVSARQIIRRNASFVLGNHHSDKEYKDYPDYKPDFLPIDLKTQLSEMQNNSVHPTQQEMVQAQAYYAAFTDVISELTTASKLEKVLIGIGMPGIKSNNGHGIIAMANGPRMPNFVSDLEKHISRIGIYLEQPIAKLGSDADYCGIGEEYAENGLFSNEKNAYYLGSGTGVADALKINGNLIPFDCCHEWIAKTWEFQSNNGKSMETYCSANGIQSIYAEISGISQNELIEQHIHLEEILSKAYYGDNKAEKTWEMVINNFALLLYERISTLYSGYQNIFEFINPNHILLDKNHEYLGTLLDKIIIGLRLGDLFKNKLAMDILINPLLKKLGKLILSDNMLDEKAKSYYLNKRLFKSDILDSSNLRDAPALGAGIAAWQHYVSK